MTCVNQENLELNFYFHFLYLLMILSLKILVKGYTHQWKKWNVKGQQSIILRNMVQNKNLKM